MRSPFAHARIVKVDVSKALEMPGVVGAWSGADLAASGRPLPMVWPITEDIKTSDHWPHHEGQGAVPGRRRRRRRRRRAGWRRRRGRRRRVRAARIRSSTSRRDEGRLPLVHDELGTNAVVHWSHGGGGDQGVFDSAPVQLRLRFEAPRITPSPIEPRGARVRGAGDGRVHAVDVDADPAHRGITCRAPPGSPSTSCGSSPRRGWGVRRQAQRLRGGGALPRLARGPAGAASGSRTGRATPSPSRAAG